MSALRVLVVFPTLWDRRQLESCRPDWEADYEVHFEGPDDEDTPASLDVEAYVEALVARWRGKVDGVFSSSDYPGAVVAATLAQRLGLPGPGPARVLSCSNKLASRRRQALVAPAAVPRFWALHHRDSRGERAGLEFPCFVKPVKGSFSHLARRVDSAADLAAFLDRPYVREYCEDYLAIFNRLVAQHTDFAEDGRWFIAEGLLRGDQVTVEGFTRNGRVEVLDVIDSVLHKGTTSFARFDLPSRHAPELQARMRELASRVMGAFGLESSMFNMELFVDPASGALSILEINPRICGQFGDLHAFVRGRSSYLVQLALCTGRPLPQRSPIEARGPFAVAASVPLRVFEPVRVAHAPDAAELAVIACEHPHAHVWVETKSGELLDDFEAREDGRSVRYAVLNLAAQDELELENERAEIEAHLAFRFEPLDETAASTPAPAP